MSGRGSGGPDGASAAREMADRVRRGAGEATRRAAGYLIGSAGEESTIDVTMLGPSGAGKTTLLASMYERFPRVIGATDLDVSAVDPDTDRTMHRYIQSLRNSPLTMQVKDQLAGTSQIREYRFEVGRRARYPVFTLRFTDYPGARITETGQNPADEQRVQRALHRADVVVVAVDVPPLVEKDGLHSDLNHADLVTSFIRRMLREDRQRLIMIVPLKCEKYLQTEELTARMIKRIREEYAPLLDYIKSGDAAQRVGCVLTPVKTLGSVVFKDISYADDDPLSPVFNFRTTSMRARYAPEDTEQPLRYALRFVLGKYMSERNSARFWLQRLFGDDRVLVKAAHDFAEGCKTGGGYEVLQDHEYLHPRRA